MDHGLLRSQFIGPLEAARPFVARGCKEDVMPGHELCADSMGRGPNRNDLLRLAPTALVHRSDVDDALFRHEVDQGARVVGPTWQTEPNPILEAHASTRGSPGWKFFLLLKQANNVGSMHVLRKYRRWSLLQWCRKTSSSCCCGCVDSRSSTGQLRANPADSLAEN